MKTLHLSIIAIALVVMGLFLVTSNLPQAFQTLSGCPPMEMGASYAFCENWAAVQTFASGMIIMIARVALIVIARKKGQFRTQSL